MEQHPVPQHIASYEFRLVGEMTLKQFSFLASGVVVALAIYAMPFPGYFKWPLVVSSAFLGFALAFIPIQERSLSQWLVAFAKAIFSPTQYLWEKKPQELEILKPSYKKAIVSEKKAAPGDQAQLTEYLKTLPTVAPAPGEETEKNYLKQVTALFQTAQSSAVSWIPLSPDQAIPTTLPTRSIPPIRPVAKPVAKKPFSPPPKAQTTSIEEKIYQPVVLPEKPGTSAGPTVKAKTTTELPIPSPPTQPNILVGMVLDQEGNLIEGSLLEIKNSQGTSVRAMKTNKLGQFRTAYPLKNDTYTIETEKEGFKFDTIKIKLKGEIVPPIEIKAKLYGY